MEVLVLATAIDFPLMSRGTHIMPLLRYILRQRNVTSLVFSCV